MPKKWEEIEQATLRHLSVPGRHTAESIGARFGISKQGAHARIDRLRRGGLVEKGWGNYSLTSLGMARIGGSSAIMKAFQSSLAASASSLPSSPVEPTAADAAPAPMPRPFVIRSPEPSTALGPDMRELIDALALGQDPLLMQANAQLRLRVSELEEEVAMLRARQQLTLERMAFAAEALTMGGAA